MFKHPATATFLDTLEKWPSSSDLGERMCEENARRERGDRTSLGGGVAVVLVSFKGVVTREESG